MNRLDGKVAIVSGGARGLGASYCRALVREGASVVLGDVLDEEGQGLADELGESATYTHLDVRDESDWREIASKAQHDFGRLDILVNNAGTSHLAPIETHSVEDWQRLLDINLTGTFLGIKACIPQLRESGRASIINISSVAGMQGFQNMAGYAASKYGVRGLTKVAAVDLGRYNIRVNSVHPGRVRTPLVESLASGLPPAESLVPLARSADPDELAALIVFLASDESSFSTGSEFIADGGRSAGQVTSTAPSS